MAVAGAKRRLRLIGLLGALACAAGLAATGSAAAAPKLKVGVGRADITPPTGYYMQGWVRSDAKIAGQHTRLLARTVVIKRGGRKVALVAEDLNGIAGGVVAEAARRLKKRGYSDRNILVSASHTHAAPSGYYNFSTYNTVFMSIDSPSQFDLTGELDPQLYEFEIARLVKSIKRADRDLAPGAIGWGKTKIRHLTENRSIEAHLRDHGIDMPYGQGTAADDPDGPLHTIDPDVNVLRVDKIVGGRRMPVGMWSNFADHGTVNKFQFTYYNEDHHAAAMQTVEHRIRRIGHVPRGQDIVNAYGNTDEGDQSAGLHRSGPAAAEHVGQVEARGFMRAWRKAGHKMSRRPKLALRWTRMCWCGQNTAAGPTASNEQFGLAEFTGSEEGRGPLFDATGVPFEGEHLPLGSGPQGTKIVAPFPLQLPTAAPLTTIRLGDRVIFSIPGEMTKQMGTRVKSAVRNAAGHGVKSAVLSGLANEYISYFTTPEEYDAQHYEGAATAYGRTSSVALQEALVALTKTLARGKKAPAPYHFDPRNGVQAGAPKFSSGAHSASVVAQPGKVARRLRHPHFSWQGAPRGFDRPLDRAFVTVQRRAGMRWRKTTSDLGLDVLWSVDPGGAYRAEWEPGLSSHRGRYRFLITANHYRLRSHRFKLKPAKTLKAREVTAPAGKVAIKLDYPPAIEHEEVGQPAPDASASLTARPLHARSGHAVFLVDGKRKRAKAKPGGRFQVSAKPGATVKLRARAARDRYGNSNGNALTLAP